MNVDSELFCLADLSLCSAHSILSEIKKIDSVPVDYFEKTKFSYETTVSDAYTDVQAVVEKLAGIIEVVSTTKHSLFGASWVQLYNSVIATYSGNIWDTLAISDDYVNYLDKQCSAEEYNAQLKSYYDILVETGQIDENMSYFQFNIIFNYQRTEEDLEKAKSTLDEMYSQKNVDIDEVGKVKSKIFQLETSLKQQESLYNITIDFLNNEKVYKVNSGQDFYFPDDVRRVGNEPDPSRAVNIWDGRLLNKEDYVYPVSMKNGLSLGAWPKDYKEIPTKINDYKEYNGFIWPATPENATYKHAYQHNGIDIVTYFGTPIYSPVDGTIKYSEWGHTGNIRPDETAYSMQIDMDNTVNCEKKDGESVDVNCVYLTHLSGIRHRVSEGEEGIKVKKGELIGYVGNASSEGWAPHLHMTLYGDDYDKGLKTTDIENLYNITDNTVRKVGE